MGIFGRSKEFEVYNGGLSNGRNDRQSGGGNDAKQKRFSLAASPTTNGFDNSGSHQFVRNSDFSRPVSAALPGNFVATRPLPPLPKVPAKPPLMPPKNGERPNFQLNIDVAKSPTSQTPNSGGKDMWNLSGLQHWLPQNHPIQPTDSSVQSESANNPPVLNGVRNGADSSQHRVTNGNESKPRLFLNGDKVRVEVLLTDWISEL